MDGPCLHVLHLKTPKTISNLEKNIVIIFFFSWRYNRQWGLYFHSPLAGFNLLAYEVT